MTGPPSSYRLVVDAEGESSFESAERVLGEMGAAREGDLKWRLGAVSIDFARSDGGADITLHIPLDMEEPPIEEAAAQGFDLARALEARLVDPQLDRTVRPEDLPEIVEQLHAHWEGGSGKPLALDRGFQALFVQSTAAMVVLLALAAAGSVSLVILVDVGERHRSAALLGGLVGIYLVLSVVDALVRRVTGWGRGNS